MNVITRKAYAKINLGLDVIKKRSDGYHEVKMIMQTIGLYDILTFSKRKEKGILLSLNQKNLPTGEDNLVYKAAALMIRACEIEEGIQINLEKRIPVAAGMAGGSTDAAAVFHGMNELLGLSLSEEDMRQLGVKIGADIPYCIMGGTALSEGIGEVLTALPAPPSAYVLIAKPEIEVSTRFVYENLHVDMLSYHPDIDGMVLAIKEQDLGGITSRMGNVLETVTIQKYPIIQDIKQAMVRSGAENALMSGSGPTVFGIYRDKEGADNGSRLIREKGMAKQVFITEFVNRSR